MSEIRNVQCRRWETVKNGNGNESVEKFGAYMHIEILQLYKVMVQESSSDVIK